METKKRLRSVLVVDDHEADVAHARLILEESQVVGTIAECCSGQDALELFRCYGAANAPPTLPLPPTVVLLDINMPGLDGFEFLAEYEANIAPTLSKIGELPAIVLMVSTPDGAFERRRAESYPSVREFARKPLTREAVIALTERFGSDE